MASRTITTSDEVDAALKFLGSRESPQLGAEQYFQDKIKDLVQSLLDDANDKRFSMVSELMNSDDKAKSITMLRELLSV